MKSLYRAHARRQDPPRFLRGAAHRVSWVLRLIPCSIAALGLVFGLLVAVTPGSAGAATATLSKGSALTPNKALWSVSGVYEAIYQTDGNFVIYQSGVGAIWWTGTNRTAPGRVLLQTDGNLVVYTAGSAALWSSQTSGENPSRLTMQTDGNLVLYDPNNQALWSSRYGKEAYGGAAAAAYANTWALTDSPTYVNMTGIGTDDCTNFVSQALYAGGQPNYVGNGSYSTPANWWEFKRSNTATAKKYSRPTGDKNASFSATAAYNLYSTLLDKGWGVYEGSYRETNGVTPEFTPTAVKTGDVLFYNWGTGSGISHTAMQVGIGTTAAGDYGNLVDEHTTNRRNAFWTLRPYNIYWQSTTIYFVHITV